MKILLIGGGGREHALAWKIAQSPLVTQLICAPGNPGIGQICQIRPIQPTDIEGLVTLATELSADLVVIGPEITIELGLADHLAEHGVACFGPSAAAGRLETSKAFAKEFATRHGLPTARYEVFDTASEAQAALDRFTQPWVIKADGLAAGKGVTIARDRLSAEAAIAEIFEGRLRSQKPRAVIEEYLVGEIGSVFALSDGKRIVMFGDAQDHKRAFDGDVGPNTGGMGAYAPAPVLDPLTIAAVRDKLIHPALLGIAEEGAPFRGVLFCEVMMTSEGPKLIEFNARFGDPECQVLMLRLRSDIVPYLSAAATGRLKNLPPPEWRSCAALCVVVAAEGYPGAPMAGVTIKGVGLDYGQNVEVFQAGVALGTDGELISSGGRILNICALGDNVTEAARLAYATVDQIVVPGSFHRRDIGWRAISAERDLAIHRASG